MVPLEKTNKDESVVEMLYSTKQIYQLDPFTNLLI